MNIGIIKLVGVCAGFFVAGVLYGVKESSKLSSVNQNNDLDAALATNKSANEAKAKLDEAINKLKDDELNI